MFLNSRDLILQDKVRLYNNIAEVNGIQGRLLAELQIWPTGKLIYDFQVLGECPDSEPSLSRAFRQKPYPPINGYCFSIDKPTLGGRRWDEGPSISVYGDTAKATFGNSTDEAHAFDFYLPNTRFQHVRANQKLLITETKIQNIDKQISERGSGYYVGVPINEMWSVSLTIQEEAQDWLAPKNRNIGTRLTTLGRLFQHNFSFENPASFDSLRSKSLEEASEELRVLSALLSFANGGYLGPFYIQGVAFQNGNNSPIHNVNAFALNYKTTPLEQLHKTWLVYDSDLSSYMKCLPTLMRMFSNPAWEEAFSYFQSHYFQTIGGGSWAIRFSALGSALERLAYAMLVVDQEDEEVKQKHSLLFNPKQKSQAKKVWGLRSGNLSIKRLQLLLEMIGLTTERGEVDPIRWTAPD